MVKRLFTAVSVVLLTSGIDATADLYGIWQFQDRAVYIDIMESGDRLSVQDDSRLDRGHYQLGKAESPAHDRLGAR